MVITSIAAGLVLLACGVALRFSLETLIWVAVCAFVAVVHWNGLRVPGGALANPFLIIATLAIAARVATGGTSLRVPGWILATGLLLFLAQLLTTLVPPSPELLTKTNLDIRQIAGAPLLVGQRSDIAQLIQIEIVILIVPILFIAAGTSIERCKRLLDLYVLSATVSAFVACLSLAGISVVDVAAQVGGRTAGLTIHPNYLSLASTMCAPLALLWFLRDGARWKVAATVSLTLLLVGVVASGSRVGAVAVLATTVGTLVLVPGLRRHLPVVAAFAGMAITLVLMFTDVGDEILQHVRLKDAAVNTAGSDLQRSSAAATALDQVRARPLQGVGMSVIGDAHNIYLQILAAGGIIALTAFLCFFAGTAVNAVRAIRVSDSDTATATTVALVSWLVSGALTNQVVDKGLYVVPGILIAMSRLEDRSRVSASVPGPVRRDAVATRERPFFSGEPALGAGRGT